MPSRPEVQIIEGHRVIFDGTLFRCTRCEARLLTAMQFNLRECPTPPVRGSTESVEPPR